MRPLFRGAICTLHTFSPSYLRWLQFCAVVCLLADPAWNTFTKKRGLQVIFALLCTQRKRSRLLSVLLFKLALLWSLPHFHTPVSALSVALWTTTGYYTVYPVVTSEGLTGIFEVLMLNHPIFTFEEEQNLACDSPNSCGGLKRSGL